MTDLADRLLALGYDGLFLRLTPAAATLWREPGAPEALAAIATDPTAPAQARFLAAEVIAGATGRQPDAALAATYAAVLRETDSPNIWGLPGELDTPPARHLLAMGVAALPPLRALLADHRRLTYAGSEEATVGNAAAWRVRDFAASMIAAISGARFDSGASPAARDAAIRRLDEGY